MMFKCFYPFCPVCIAKSVYELDSKVRHELIHNNISDENDYVSTLMSKIRDFFTQQKISKHCISRRLSKTQENKFGCDAMIVFRFIDTAKICAFEAKYPRLNKKLNYGWDSSQKTTGKSHFSDQITRQSNWKNDIYIWEFFILDYAFSQQAKVFDDFGSTCIWHKPTFNYDRRNINQTTLWQQKDLINLVTTPKRKIKSKNSLNIYEILLQILLDTNTNKQRKVKNGSVTVRSNSGEEEEITIPASLENVEEQSNRFLEQSGIANFLFIQLNDYFEL